MFSPRFIFIFLWGMQVVLHAGFYDIFFPFDDVTWIAILLAMVFFNVGVSVVNYLPGLQFGGVPQAGKVSRQININRCLQIFLSVYVVAAVYAVFSICNLMLGGGLAELSAPLIRQFVVDDFSGDRALYGFFRILYLGVGFNIFFLAFAKSLSRGQIAAILVIGLLSAVATTGRLFLLLFFTAAISLLHRNKVISTRSVFISAFAFIIIFFVIAFVFQKGEESNSVAGNILWNAQVYVMSSISCLNDFVVSRAQEIEGGALLPNPIRGVVSIFLFDIPLRPSLNPFAEVPLPCNTYTVLFPLFHDAGLLGVAMGMLFIGIFHQYLYVRYKNSSSPLWWYFYSISIYPLVMSVFEDAYFSSFGFWLLLWVPPICYLIARKLRWVSDVQVLIENK